MRCGLIAVAPSCMCSCNSCGNVSVVMLADDSTASPVVCINTYVTKSQPLCFVVTCKRAERCYCRRFCVRLSVTVTRRLKLHSRPRSLLCQSVLAMHSSVLRAASGGDSRLVRRPISVNKIFGTTKLRYELDTAHFH